MGGRSWRARRLDQLARCACCDVPLLRCEEHWERCGPCVRGRRCEACGHCDMHEVCRDGGRYGAPAAHLSKPMSRPEPCRRCGPEAVPHARPTPGPVSGPPLAVGASLVPPAPACPSCGERMYGPWEVCGVCVVYGPP